MLSYVFLTILDLPAQFISAKLPVAKSLKMVAKLGDWRKLGKFTGLQIFSKGRASKFFSVVTFSMAPTSQLC